MPKMFTKQFFNAISSNRCKKLGNSVKCQKIRHGKNLLYVHMKTPHFHNKSKIIKKYFFLTPELSLINTCCWRADHEILIHDGASRRELIFVSARQHMC